jgi:hypothetical protein
MNLIFIWLYLSSSSILRVTYALNKYLTWNVGAFLLVKLEPKWHVALKYFLCISSVLQRDAPSLSDRYMYYIIFGSVITLLCIHQLVPTVYIMYNHISLWTLYRAFLWSSATGNGNKHHARNIDTAARKCMVVICVPDWPDKAVPSSEEHFGITVCLWSSVWEILKVQCDFR